MHNLVLPLSEADEVVLCRVEFLCHDINVHVPHHVNSKIPWYNLRAATDSLRQNWGQVCTQALCCTARTHHGEKAHIILPN